MGLITCPDCLNRISENSSVCIHCGAPIEEYRKKLLFVEMGKTIFFGQYPKNKNGEKQPVEWMVLDKCDDKALIISKYVIDCKQYGVFKKHLTLFEWLCTDPKKLDLIAW